MVADDMGPDIVQFLSETKRVTIFRIPCKVVCVKRQGTCVGLVVVQLCLPSTLNPWWLTLGLGLP
jgi:hypothetical protein